MPATNHKHNPSERPIKPWPDFPFFPHSTGRGATKIQGKLHCFGPWDDPNGAYRRDLGRNGGHETPRSPSGRPGSEQNQDSTGRPNRGLVFRSIFTPPASERRRFTGDTRCFGTDADEAFKLYRTPRRDGGLYVHAPGSSIRKSMPAFSMAVPRRAHRFRECRHETCRIHAPASAP